MFNLNSTIKDLLETIPSYQPISAEGFYKPGWWVNLPREQQHQYIVNLGLAGVDLRDKSFMDVGCAEGYACFYAEEQGARFVVGCDGHGWKYGLDRPDVWTMVHPQNEIILFELQKLLKRSRVVRLAEDVESPDFADSVARLGCPWIDVVLCAGVLYHTLNPVQAVRNVFLVTGELAIFNVPDFRQLQADGRTFTPYANRPESNDFNYDQVLPYGVTNNRFWNMSPDDWQSMMHYVGFGDIETEPSGMCTIYRCRVARPFTRLPSRSGPAPAPDKDSEIARLRALVAAYERGRFMRGMKAVRTAWQRLTRGGRH